MVTYSVLPGGHVYQLFKSVVILNILKQSFNTTLSMQFLFMSLMKVRGSASFSFACVEIFMTRLYLSSFGDRERERTFRYVLNSLCLQQTWSRSFRQYK